MAGKDDSPQRLSEAIKAAMEASSSRNAQMEQEAKTLYTIDIPAQKLFISDRQLAQGRRSPRIVPRDQGLERTRDEPGTHTHQRPA